MIPAVYIDSWHPAGLPVSLGLQNNRMIFELLIDGASRQLTWKNDEVNLSYHKIDRSIILTYSQDETTQLRISSGYTRDIEIWLQQREGRKRRLTVLLSRSVLIGILLFALSIIPITYFVLLPVIADYIAGEMPEKKEIELGNSMSQQILLSMKEIPERSAGCDSFVTALGQAYDFPIRVHVVESKELNAFSLPGGHVFVHSAMLDSCKTKEELAALLGHEIGHIELRHAVKAVMRNLVTTAMLTFITGDYSSVVAIGASKANELKNLGYSRELETEADGYSINLLAGSGLDPNGIIALFQVLESEEKKTAVEIPEMLRSHPLNRNRIYDSEQSIAKLGNYNVKENPDLDRIFSGLKSGSQSKSLSW